MELKVNEQGKVEFELITGKDRVKGVMLESEAMELVSKGKTQKKGGNIIVDNKFIFELDDVPLDEVDDEPLVVEEKKSKRRLKDEPEKTLSDKPLRKNAKKRK